MQDPIIQSAMVKSKAARLQTNAMGQTSSQPAPAELPQMERTVKSKDKKRKSRRGKRQSEVEQHPIDQEEESARALLLMREGPVHDSRAPYYQDDLAASQQLIAESSPTRPSELANGDESAVISSQKSSTHKSRKSNEKRRSDPCILAGSKGKGEEMQYPHLPSTPPNQVVHSSPPPYRPSTYQSAHALDGISSDDEAVASYLQEYEKNNGIAHLPATSEDDTYEISQQPPHVSDGEGYGIAEHSTYDLAHKASAKQKKRKRDRASTSDDVDDQQQPLENVEGQHILQADLGTFDHLFEEDRWANPYGHYQDNMPIDPKLHSMSALPPSVDLSHLGNSVDNAGQKKKQKTKHNGLAASSKHRQREEASTAPNHRVPYYSPYALDHLQDRVLPDFGDSQGEASAELGSPYIEDIANKGLEYLSDPATPGPSAQQEKKVSSSKASVSKKPKRDTESKSSPKIISKSGGQWTAAEAEKLDNFRDSYCDANNISREKFNTHIQSTIRTNLEAKALFDELHEVVPYRPRLSVQKFCRRRYHNFPARGIWTTEEDEMLKRAVAANPNRWKAIGEMLDRMGEDCRDRYRNYLLNSENRNREAWSNEEVQSLCKAILESKKAMQDERRQAKMEQYGEDAPKSDFNSDQEDQDMKVINWQNISDRMGGVRSRLQCRLKWLQLKEWEQKNYVESAIDAKGFEGRKSVKTKNPWRIKKAFKKVANMRAGDQYALLQAILDSGASTEDNVPWKTIGDAKFQATWNSADKKAAWANLKQDFPGSHSVGYRAIAKGLRKRLLADHRDALDERWDPEVHGDVSAKKPRRKKDYRREQGDNEEELSTTKRRAVSRARKSQDKKSSSKSDEYVRDSDQEEVADSADEPQSRNSHDAWPRSNGAEVNLDASMEKAITTDDEQEGVHSDGYDADSLFEEQMNNEKDQPMVDRDVSQDLASRVHLLKQAWAS